ncbi:myricetin 3-O-rhamnoside 1,2-glucosyltransferase UGT709G2-like [Dioscorea cayenensis subsp. rotundata]|uniref:Myricetin 3-O-rhamnoside 1,2-glucosyltransferase UGT709G2-like n=1 Tax=Dioscorea cayennensis subsp. rotundata TaxID=55577 RepID=A0AB40BXU3_DIOCR|nr:myricetin 3-O-rhamnoside 1,2-glucosyltransferase UGT709G2-like [Dioscorea cayenensis subsp. rotundata]
MKKNKNKNKNSWVKNSCSSSLRQEDRACMTWLDNQPDKSVIYVSFGTVAVMSPEQFIEFWHGLVNSGHRFLWAVREDMVERREEMEVTKEMEEGAKKRGCMVEWVPQEEVLAHRAVGCFLTHCGWNSTLEGMVAGVPMICWPYFSDQMINSRFVSDVWRIGLDMKDTCDRNTVERMVREVMEGENALELRSSAARMADFGEKEHRGKMGLLHELALRCSNGDLDLLLMLDRLDSFCNLAQTIYAFPMIDTETLSTTSKFASTIQITLDDLKGVLVYES